jgi:2-keto-4-pentenoate hydratase/2-oxohepta-3-ene-1,7-dioic acid hydratase in catechol pathway
MFPAQPVFHPLSRRRGEDGVTEGAPENVKHGDTTDIEITGIATLSNPIVREG